MAMKLKFNLEALLAVQWWIPAAVASGLYMLFEWGAPALAGVNPMIMVAGVILRPFGIGLAAVFGIFAAVLFYRQRIGKTKKVVRLLEPHISVPPPPRLKLPKLGASRSAPDKPAAEALPTLPAASSSPWSVELLRRVKAAQFDELVAAYFRELSFRTETSQVGSDEGKQIKLFEKGKTGVYAVVHCLACDARKTGVSAVRELLGAMTHDKVPRGVLVVSGEYTEAASDFAKHHPIILITGDMLVKDMQTFSEDANTRLMNVVAEGGLEAAPLAAEAGPVEAGPTVADNPAAPDSNVIEFNVPDQDSGLWPKL